MIIDPPVSPYSDVQDIRDWVQQLRHKQASAKGENAEAINHAIDEARGWLKLKGAAMADHNEEPLAQEPPMDFDFDKIEIAKFAEMLREHEEVHRGEVAFIADAVAAALKNLLASTHDVTRVSDDKIVITTTSGGAKPQGYFQLKITEVAAGQG